MTVERKRATSGPSKREYRLKTERLFDTRRKIAASLVVFSTCSDVPLGLICVMLCFALLSEGRAVRFFNQPNSFRLMTDVGIYV